MLRARWGEASPLLIFAVLRCQRCHVDVSNPKVSHDTLLGKLSHGRLEDEPGAGRTGLSKGDRLESDIANKASKTKANMAYRRVATPAKGLSLE